LDVVLVTASVWFTVWVMIWLVTEDMENDIEWK
jgi:hypothetical protein